MGPTVETKQQARTVGERFARQGVDKALTLTQCRFEAKVNFGIETIIVADFDEFLYCPSSDLTSQKTLKETIREVIKSYSSKDNREPFTSESKKLGPITGRALLNINDISVQVDCFYRAVYETWKPEVDRSKPNHWATLLLREEVMAQKNKIGVCVAIPYASSDREKHIGNAAMLREWIKYYVNLDMKVFIYDRSGNNYDSVYNNGIDSKLHDNIVYYNYTMRGFLNPHLPYLFYDNNEQMGPTAETRQQVRTIGERFARQGK
eukprot:gene20170-26185_t